MIKKFDEYIKENFEEEEEDVYGKYNGEIETVDDIDWNQMNRLPSLYKNRYVVTIDYDIILPDSTDKGEMTEEQVKAIVEEDLKRMSNGEVSIDKVHKVHKRF
jgi:hypothetical protein